MKLLQPIGIIILVVVLGWLFILDLSYTPDEKFPNGSAPQFSPTATPQRKE